MSRFRIPLLRVLCQALCLGLALAPASARPECLKPVEGTGQKKQIISAFGPYAFTDDADLDTKHSGLDDDMTPARLAQLAAGRRKYCARGAGLIANASDVDTIAFPNPAGAQGTGLCWWMARLQRSMRYLGNFFPGRPKPDAQAAQAIVNQLVAGDKVVEIPGYPNIHAFTKEHEAEITKTLSAWQNRETLLVAPDADALLRVGSESPGQLQERMSALYSRMLNHPALLVAKIPLKDNFGTTHAITITSVEPIRQGGVSSAMVPPVGYRTTFIDPNYPNKKITSEYHFGDTSLQYPPAFKTSGFSGTFLPNIAYDGELSDHENAIRAYCGRPKK